MCKTDIDSEAVMGALKSGSFDIGENPYSVMTSIKDYTNSIFEAINELQTNWKSAVDNVGEYIDVFQEVPEPGGEDLTTLANDLESGTQAQLNGVTTSLRVRSNAGTENGVVGSLTPGTDFTVVGTEKDSSGSTWYRVKYKDKNGNVVEGYASGDYVKVDESSFDATTPSNNVVSKPTTPSSGETVDSTYNGSTSTPPSSTPEHQADTPGGTTNPKTQESGKVVGVVDNIKDTNSHLNIRSTADGGNNGNIIGQYSQGDKIEILGEENGFYRVRTSSGTTGYVSKKYVTIPENSKIPSSKVDIPPKTTVKVENSNSRLNFRNAPNSSSSNNIIGSIDNGAELDVLDRSGDWTKVRYNGQEGWVYTKYLTK